MDDSRSTARARWGGLTREAVIEAATTLVDRSGDGELSIRALAATLDVSPMALYRHVADKHDLMAAVVDQLWAERWEPGLPRTEWRAWIIDAADRQRRFLVEKPAALRVYLEQPVVSAAAMERMGACIEVLRAALGDDDRAHRAYAAVHTYTVGFAAFEAARSSAHEPVDDAERELAAFVSPAQFETGLGYLLDGISSAGQ
ncbi:MAG TPA: TetR/AcrR family transcriptional regulator C-terminal domain-containing protein [Jatrophihabitans sp.]|jgi:AcrR family transcriptional regulator